MSTELPRPRFDSPAAYAAIFNDMAYWQPYVAAICARHGQDPALPIRATLPGTHAVFVVGEHMIVKLYTDLFNSADSYSREHDSYRQLAQQRTLPVPELIAQGQLFSPADGWPWPYIISTRITGESYGQAQARLSDEEQLHVAGWLGSFARQLHTLPVLPGVSFQPTWDAFAAFLAARRAACVADQRRWQVLPPALIDQIDAYLPPLDELIDRSHPPSLIHADLNADHLLGQDAAGHWQPTGVIDFGDARVGDPSYELVALHLGLFGGDRRLLQRYLTSYGCTVDADFVRRAMSYTLLHEFGVLDGVRHILEQPTPARNLDQLARRLWAVNLV